MALREIERILSYIEGELRCRRSVLTEALYNVSVRTPKPYNLWLLELIKIIDSQSNNVDKDEFYEFYYMWTKSLDYLRANTLLSSKDISLLCGVGKALGYLDIESQQMNLSLEREHIHSYILDLDKDVNLRMKNAIILCFLGGVMTVIALL